ncbi:hypothetical protein JCM19239_2307 [Vibrio variabilis]|uniref:Antibiotic biosynthesis monooxygenase n=1 Tax=Vibrio variabilis TaxID=990271 RepID=A0ABQ0JB54_9VIBR|nr:hypothetical protein JCM19239_2307 [Vibrio variabilis]
MFAVIFKATIRTLDKEYSLYANQLRDLAMSKYGCIDFVSSSEGNQELAISYWVSEQDIERWRDDPLHRKAQLLGKDKWYVNYTVEVVEVKRSYSSERVVS